jgi:hypothetical protein
MGASVSDLFAPMRKLKGELLAIVAIVGMDMYFLIKAFEYRKNFILHLDFWMIVAFVQTVVLLLCYKILDVYLFRVTMKPGSGSPEKGYKKS